jgi:mRNA-degrading endonuclease toxin of MazEF toxin-antitoxin module
VSKQRLSDAAKTAVLFEAACELHDQFSVSYQAPTLAREWALVSEVLESTGSGGGRADLFAVNLWQSRHQVIGYEIKASRADLQRELKDPAKAARFARYCHQWRLVVWDRTWLLDGGLVRRDIPGTWGLYAYDAEAGGLKVVRPAVKLQPDEWPRHFTLGLLRRAIETGAGTAVLLRAVEQASERGAAHGKQVEAARIRQLLAPLDSAVRESMGLRWGRPTIEDIIAFAVSKLAKEEEAA